MVDLRPIEQLFFDLHQREVEIWQENNKLLTKSKEGAITLNLREEIKARKVELIAFLAQSVQSIDAISIQKAPYNEDIPLSFSQQGIWFLAQMGVGNAFNFVYQLPLQGQLNHALLEQSLIAIIQRHIPFRTRFIQKDGIPLQKIRESIDFVLPLVKLQPLSKEEQSNEIAKIAKEQVIKEFDLEKDLLLRATLLQLQPEKNTDKKNFLLLLTMNHIAFDGWSMDIFRHELEIIYNTLLADKKPALSPLLIQYSDFSLWQRRYLQGDVLKNKLAYWKQQLVDVPHILQLPLDYIRPTNQSYQGSHVDFNISTRQTTLLKQLSQRYGATLFMTLLSIFQILLHTYTHQKKFLLATVIANRQQQELESLIGLFINTLVLHADFSEPEAGKALTFEQLLLRVQQITQNAYEHQDVPFERLIDELNVERNLSYHPLIQVMFVLQNTPLNEINLNGLETSHLSINDTQSTRYDLEFHLLEIDGKLKGTFIYSEDLFTKATIVRMTGHFLTLVNSILINHRQPINQLSLLTKSETQQILEEWNNTTTDYPNNLSIQQLFERQAIETPDAIALEFTQTGKVSEKEQKKSAISYQVLNERANQLAHYLLSSGVKPHTPIGFCLDRSMDVFIGILSILKIGGIYVPLNPKDPKERLAFILQDTSILFLLSHSDFLPTLPEGITTLCLNLTQDLIAKESKYNLNNQSLPNDPVYIMYTSGSTGEPKGVRVTHQNVIRLVKNTNYAQLTKDEVFLQLAPISFDASTLEIWGAFLNGAKLVVMPPEEPSLQELGKVIRQHQISILWLTAGFFHLMVDEHLEGLRPLRQLLIGGDILSPLHIKKVLQQLPHCQVICAYGPTENTTFTTCFAVEKINNVNIPIPIGRPIANTKVYLLNEEQQLVPVGISGELYTAGDGVALGYHNRPKLNKERFLPNPFGTGSLYRTGDLARWMPNGNIEFLGRIDNQVKLRGFRIELSEIEIVLTNSLWVNESIVMMQKDHEQSTHKYLVAYVILKENKASVQTMLSFQHPLHEYLSSKLPDYMIPTFFMVLNTLPLNANGKVDRAALPSIEKESKSSKEIFIAPINPIEIALVDIWCDVLGLTTIGIHDNFFELGGDSIIAIQLASRAKIVGIQLTPRQLFQAQTVAALAQIADITEREELTNVDTLIKGHVPLLPIQSWFFEHHPIALNHFNLSLIEDVKDIQLKRNLLLETITQWIRHHDALRLSYFYTDEAGWQQEYLTLSDDMMNNAWWLTLAENCFCIIDLEHLDGLELRQALISHNASLQKSLDITKGRVLKVVWFKTGSNQPDRLLFIVHHLVADLVSLRLLIPDFWSLYSQIEQKKSPQLPSKSSSLQQWGQYLQKYAESKVLLGEMTYWLTLQKYFIEPLPVDYDFPPRTATFAEANKISCSFSVEETETLLQEIPSVYNTQINDILLTALTQTLVSWTEQSGVLIDLEGHGRENLTEVIDLSRTVGWFTSIFPIYLQLANDSQTLGDTIKSIKEQLRSIPQKGIGYGVLRYLNPKTRKILMTLPQAQVSFNYGGQFKEIGMESLGNEWSRETALKYKLNITGAVVDNKLSFNWLYSEKVYHERTIEKLNQDFIKSLRTLIKHCQSSEAGGYTPSDFPNIALTEQIELDSLLDVINSSLEEE